jgi:hypothetical protein
MQVKYGNRGGVKVKKLFCGFYSLNDENIVKDIWNSNKTVFIFDTNCLLNLYRCEDKTRDDILSVMTRLSNKIWLPFFVCLEYQKNRRTVISESISSLNQISKSLDSVVTSITDSLSAGKVKKHLYNSLSDDIHSLQGEIKPLIEKFIQEHIEPRISSKTKIDKKDIIRDEIDKLVADRCGSPPSKEWISEINSKGDYRYSNEIPPGFLDAGKKGKKHYNGLEFEEKYGDLYIWMEIVEKCVEDEIENVIFICDDNKNDWWYEKKGITHGPLESLQTEIHAKSNVKNFKLLNQATFLRDAQKYLSDINIDLESLKEVQDISENTKVAMDQWDKIRNEFNIEFTPSLSEQIRDISRSFIPEHIKSDRHYFRSTVSARNLSRLVDEISLCIFKLRDLRERLIDSESKVTIPKSDFLKKITQYEQKLSNYKLNISEFLDVVSGDDNGRIAVSTSLQQKIKTTTSESREFIEYVSLILDVI